MVTYGMMDLPMTIIRPFAAFLTAFIAGILQNVFDTDITIPLEEEKKSCCAGGKTSKVSTFKKIVKYAYSDLLEDFALWLIIGILFGAMVDVLVPAEFFSRFDGWTARFAFILVGIPLYICASATTPIAASLMLKGLSPGTALIILLVGPATNVSNILILQKYLGKKAVMINIATISLTALALSFGVDFLYSQFNLPLIFKVDTHGEQPGVITTVLTVIFSLLLFRAFWVREIRTRLKGKKACA